MNRSSTCHKHCEDHPKKAEKKLYLICPLNSNLVNSFFLKEKSSFHNGKVLLHVDGTVQRCSLPEGLKQPWQYRECCLCYQPQPFIANQSKHFYGQQLQKYQKLGIRKKFIKTLQLPSVMPPLLDADVCSSITFAPSNIYDEHHNARY